MPEDKPSSAPHTDITFSPSTYKGELMTDGLYQAQKKGITAGFTVSYGIVNSCAPILRKHIANQAWSLRQCYKLHRLGYQIKRIGD
jgi:hypothetical protein